MLVGRSFHCMITAPPRHHKTCSSFSARAACLSRSFCDEGCRAPPSFSHLARALVASALWFRHFGCFPVMNGNMMQLASKVHSQGFERCSELISCALPRKRPYWLYDKLWLVRALPIKRRRTEVSAQFRWQRLMPSAGTLPRIELRSARVPFAPAMGTRALRAAPLSLIGKKSYATSFGNQTCPLGCSGWSNPSRHCRLHVGRLDDNRHRQQ